MVLQIVVLIAPAVILGVIASDKKLMGDLSLKGFNQFIYWFFIALILSTGLASILPFFGIKL
jgi:Mn2+/Fe2+ NRAMP family transporter